MPQQNLNSNEIKDKNIIKSSRSSLDKYKKDLTKKSSSEQFKKYLIDANNVFFEDRDSLKQLIETKRKLKYLVSIWFVLALIYFFLNRIKPFSGYCPPNATCRVFKRCNPGYELSEDGRSCHVEKSIVNHIEKLCKF